MCEKKEIECYYPMNVGINESEVTFIKRLNEKYEYRDYVDLDGVSGRYFYVPHTLIQNTELGAIRISVFTYLSLYRGLNNKLIFSIPRFLKWANYTSDSHKNGINVKVIETLNLLNSMGYIVYRDNGFVKKTSSVEIEIRPEFVGTECSGGFGVLYVDEVERIMNYKIESKSTHFNCNTVLLVFAYLRDAIYRTPNELKPEEQSPEKIADRKKRLPEAYNATFKEIASHLGISDRCVSDAVDILEEELKLIVTARAYHYRNENGEFRTPDILFANAYKREDKKLLTFDESYAREQIENKATIMRGYFEKYYLRDKKELFKKIG